MGKKLNWGSWDYNPKEKVRTFRLADPLVLDVEVLAFADDGETQNYAEPNTPDLDVLWVKGDYEGGATLEIGNEALFAKLAEAIKQVKL